LRQRWTTFWWAMLLCLLLLALFPEIALVLPRAMFQ